MQKTLTFISAFLLSISSLTIKPSNTSSKKPHKADWTFITYMSADNNLNIFARTNLSQQAEVGSNKNLNIITQLDTRIGGNKKITKRYFVEKNKLTVVNQNDPSSQKMDSGSPETLINLCLWAMEEYPAKHYALVLWNHGTGIIDIGRPRRFNPLQLFIFNPNNNMIELDRSIPFLDFVQAIEEPDLRGICFDDTTGHYLTNQDLELALNTICNKHGKFDIIAMDACLMAMIEVANIVKPYANFLIASQEVELGPGYNYKKLLSFAQQENVSPGDFAAHFVLAYQETYAPITHGFTQSAIRLEGLFDLEKNVNHIALLLIECLKHQKGQTVRDAIKASKHKMLCTSFDEPSYKDLHHFYRNLSQNCKLFQFKDSHYEILKKNLEATLLEGRQLIEQTVIANAAGKNLNSAKGLSIYLPDKNIHNSYVKTNFAKSTNWVVFLKYLISLG